MQATRLLLADDHAVVRAGIRNALEALPNIEIVGEVGDGPTLMQALSTLEPECLLLDLTMPDFDPLHAIRQIRGTYPHLLILVVSAYDDDEYVQGFLSAGVNGYHLKDQPLRDLQLAVERVLSGERWISSSLLDKLLRPSQPVTTVPQLSTRQREILDLLVKGQDNRGIANTLHLSVKTIENHLTRLYRQLNVNSRLEAVTFVHDHPQLLAHKGATAVDTTPLPIPQAEQASILLVDDNRRFRTQLRRMIDKEYTQVLLYEAANITDAVNLAQRVTPQLAFVDVVLANESGILCTRRIKKQAPATRIILISAYPDREFHRLGLEAGATAFIDKKDLDTATINRIIADSIL